MENEIEITKIVIKIGRAKHELTIEQAKALLLALQELLGDKEKIYYPIVYPYPHYPYYPSYPTWTVTVGDTASP